MWKKLLLSHRRILHVDWFGAVTKCWGLAKNDERANDRSYCEDPQKKSIKNHCYETPILIFLWNKKKRLYISEPSLYSSNIYIRTALNSSCRCMWCWMNITLCKAFSSSKGYFFLGVTSLRDSSNPDITVGSPLYPPIPPRNLLCADVVCNPLHPEKNYPLTPAIFVSFTWLRTKQ